MSIAAVLGSSWLVDDYGYAGVELLNEKAMRVCAFCHFLVNTAALNLFLKFSLTFDLPISF